VGEITTKQINPAILLVKRNREKATKSEGLHTEKTTQNNTRKGGRSRIKEFDADCDYRTQDNVWKEKTIRTAARAKK